MLYSLFSIPYTLFAFCHGLSALFAVLPDIRFDVLYALLSILYAILYEICFCYIFTIIYPRFYIDYFLFCSLHDLFTLTYSLFSVLCSVLFI